MPYRPLRLGLTTGCDICHKPRIARLLRYGPPRRDASKTNGQQADTARQVQNVNNFLGRLLGFRELALLWVTHGNVELALRPDRFSMFVDTIAGRWAAKEAVKKACHHRRLTWHDIMILKHASGAPYGVVLDDVKSAISEAAVQNLQQGQSSQLTTPDGDAAMKSFDLVAASGDDGESATVSGSAPREQRQPAALTGGGNGFMVDLSISHDGSYAMATCIMPSEIPPPHYV